MFLMQGLIVSETMDYKKPNLWSLFKATGWDLYTHSWQMGLLTSSQGCLTAIVFPGYLKLGTMD